jgi:hypothetical protein
LRQSLVPGGHESDSGYRVACGAVNAEMKALNITGDRFHPEWNYKITPRQQPP